MEILDNRALIVNTKYPNRITEAITKSKVIKKDHELTKVLVNWGFEEAQKLNELRFKNVPSPIERDYDWPGKHVPMKHQKTTASFLSITKRGFCFNEQGTGKTASAIWAADYLLNKGIIKKILVVCPLSIMFSAWEADLFKFAIHRTVNVAYGSRKKRQKVVEDGAEFTIINYDGVEIIEEDIKKANFDLIIIDEANAYKSVTTKRWKAMNKLVTADTWLWLMTGTPAAQSPVDAFGLAKLCNPTRCPQFFGRFRDMVMINVGRFKWIPRTTAEDTVFRILQPAIRFAKAECIDLPDVTHVSRNAPLTPQQNKYYKELKTKLRMEVTGEEITAHNAAIGMNKLLQIASGAVYTDKGDVLEFDIKNRYKVLKEVIDEASQKVLVFVPFRHTIDLLRDKLIADKIPTDVIRGDVPAHKRTEIFKAFQETTIPKVLLIQPQSAAHGVTLTKANVVVWWSPISSLETYAQANARVHRAGQTHKCTVVQLQGSNTEKHVYRLLDNRIHLHTKIIELYKEILD